MPTALVTGPTSGIGRAFADQLAAKGLDLVLVSRDAERLQAVARAIEQRYGVGTEVLAADLTVPADLERVSARLGDDEWPVHTLVNNAGYAINRRFVATEPDELKRQVELHAVAVTRLTRAALPGMQRRGRGVVLTVASVAGLLPRVSSPIYAATKAFEIAFTCALAKEVAGTGVRVCVVCPGMTVTEFHDRAGMDVSRLPAYAWLEPDRVVAEALRDVARGRLVSVPSRRYRLGVALARALPDRLVGAAVRVGGRRA